MIPAVKQTEPNRPCGRQDASTLGTRRRTRRRWRVPPRSLFSPSAPLTLGLRRTRMPSRDQVKEKRWLTRCGMMAPGNPESVKKHQTTLKFRDRPRREQTQFFSSEGHAVANLKGVRGHAAADTAVAVAAAKKIV